MNRALFVWRLPTATCMADIACWVEKLALQTYSRHIHRCYSRKRCLTRCLARATQILWSWMNSSSVLFAVYNWAAIILKVLHKQWCQVKLFLSDDPSIPVLRWHLLRTSSRMYWLLPEVLFNLSSTSSRVNVSIASLQRSIVTISDRHIASKLKNQISAELSDKDEALKVLNSHRNNILRVLSTSANIPEMMEELIYVSSSAACSTRLELCCASLR